MSDKDDGFLLQQMVCDTLPLGSDYFLDVPGFPNPSWASNFPSPSFQASLLEDLLVADDAADQMQRWEAAKSPGSPKSELLADVLRRIFSQKSEFLAQVWVPTLRNSRLMLTTQDQPYAVQSSRSDLVRYRALSARYAFPAQRGVDAFPGMPGRVFRRMAPEWSPNVQCYDSSDFLRVQDAARCNVRGTLAVPVIEPRTRECLAVIELASNVEKIGYEAEMGMICKALQDVNLSSWVGSESVPEVPRAGREAVFEEISAVLVTVCETQRLPLAQTWIPCLGEDINKKSPASSERKLASLIAKNTPYHCRDPALEGFHQACSEQGLEAGQGVAGKASTTNKPSFAKDITSFSIAEYPLVHYARYFKLGAAVAIRLRSLLTGSDDYVLEFVLPPQCVNDREQQQILAAISATMQQACQSLRTVSSEEVLEPLSANPQIVEFEEISGVVDNFNASAGVLQNKKSVAATGESSYWSGTSSTPPVKKKTDKKRASNEKTVPLDVLQQHFAGSLRDAAKSIGVCPTTLKRICRQYGISRWPSRKINKVNRSLVKLQGVINSVEGVERRVKLDSLTGEIASAAAATAAITMKHNHSGSSASRSSSEKSCAMKPGPCSQGKEGINVFQGRDPSTSNELQISESRVTLLPAIKLEPRVHGSSAALSVLDRSSPDQTLRQNQGERSPGDQAGYGTHHPQNPLGASSSSPTFIDWQALATRVEKSVSPPAQSNEEQLVTVKATLRGDTIRFKLALDFGFGKLKAEVGSRFKLEAEAFSLKYMDDDAEWVVLNGDADLDECMDVMRSSKTHIIKLVVHVIGGAGSPSFCSVNS